MKRIVFICFMLLNVVFAQNLIVPIPDHIKYDANKAKLGKFLFFDSSFSADGKISCASCHNPSEGWADKRKVSIGVFGRKGDIQSPTVLNSVFNFRQFWNGRAKNLVEQIEGPVNNTHEMNVDKKLLIKKLKNDRFYRKLFKKAFHTDKITFKMYAEAIAEYEKTLITPDCKFDLYLKGGGGLSKNEIKGYILFKKYGCITCHNGINIGGNSFQKMGLIFPFKNCTGDRYEITHNPLDKCVYKVPTLRNIALTAPYFHDGSAKTLFKAVEVMAYHNLGFKLPEKDAKLIVLFLKTLTGKLPKVNKVQ